MTSPRRRRLWLPFSTGDNEVTLAFNGTDRLFIASINELEQGRQLERYTVQRSVFTFSAWTDSGANQVVVGLIGLQEDVAVGSVDPEDDPGADWLYHEQFTLISTESGHTLNLIRDIRSQRIMRGNDSELYMYIRNRDTGTNLIYAVTGRILVLL